MQFFIRPVLKEGRLKSILSYLHAHEEFENFCFVSAAPTVCVLRAFVYDAVNLNKIVIISSTKLPSYCVSICTSVYMGNTIPWLMC